MNPSLITRIALVSTVGVLSAPTSVAQTGVFTLIDAVREDRSGDVTRLLQAGVSVHAVQPDGGTALHWAVHRNNVEIASRLLAAGADADAANELGVRPIALACTNGNTGMVRMLLVHGASADAALPTGVTPLMTCARSGVSEAALHLLEYGADVNAREAVRGQTALMWAVAERHAHVVSTLIAAGADVQVRSDSGFTPLLFAAQQGDEASARLLLDAGVDIDETGGDGSAALLVATESGHAGMVQFLVDAGANIDAVSAGRAALHAAVQHQRPDIVALLLDLGAEPNVLLREQLPRFAGDLSVTTGPGSMVGATPFWLAAKFTDVGLMRLLVDRGADPRLPSDDGTTPLMVAAGIGFLEGYDRYGRLLFNDDTRRREQHDLEAVKLAFHLGGGIDVVNEHGQTVMHGAAYAGNDPVVRFLAEQGAALNSADRTGLTPLAITEGLYVSGTFLARETTGTLLRDLGAIEGERR